MERGQLYLPFENVEKQNIIHNRLSCSRVSRASATWQRRFED